MMRRIQAIIFLTFFIFTLWSSHAYAHGEESGIEEFYRAKVMRILEEGMIELAGMQSPFQRVMVEFLNGPEKGHTAQIEYGTVFTLDEERKVKVGERVIVSVSEENAVHSYSIVDTDRTRPLIIIGLIFLACAVVFAGVKGLTSLLGMVFSVILLASFVLPSIIAGGNPLVVSLVGTAAIAFVSLYLAHGFNRRTTIALISTFVTLGLATLLSSLFVTFAKLYGFGREETQYLQWGPFADLNFRGLLLGGIIIGALGVLDDITTAQVAIVYELKKANPKFGFSELCRRALAVGREHITSLVNTLVLAYAGASLPALLLFTASSEVPFWIAINSEFIAEEIVRTLVGSTVLIFAVPITTIFAAWRFSKRE